MATIRRILRRFLLWVLALLEDEPAPQSVNAGGPPQDWLARVRRGAPQLLEPAAASQPFVTPPPPPRLMPRAAARPQAQAKMRRTRAVIEEELVARSAREVVRLSPVGSERSGGPGTAGVFAGPRTAGVLAGWSGAVSAPAAAGRRRTSRRDAGGPRAGMALHPEIADMPTPEHGNLRTTRHPESAKRDEGSRDAKTPVISRSFAVFAAQDDGSRDLRSSSFAASDPRTAGVPAAPGTAGVLAGWSGAVSAPPAAERRRTSRRDAGAPEENRSEGAGAHPWPDLPPLPPIEDAIESLDDPDRLPRLADEQRRNAWSE